MDVIAYVFILACLIGLFFFAIFFREKPTLEKIQSRSFKESSQGTGRR